MSHWMNIMRLIIGRLITNVKPFSKADFEDIPLLDLALSDEKYRLDVKRLYY